MPYDYYDFLKKQRNSDNYQETTDIIREEIWNDSFDFKLSVEWLTIEETLKIKLYQYLLYN